MPYYSIEELAHKAGISNEDLFECLMLGCSHVCGQDGIYAVTDSGKDLGGLNIDSSENEYGVLFPLSVLNDDGVKDAISEKLQKTHIKRLLMHR